jgi:hypothetical protein
MSRDFSSLVIWTYEVVVSCAKIVIFGFFSPAGGYAEFYPVAKDHVAICLVLTQGLL